MSIKLMTKVWENGPEDRTETMVLLALADRANDDGGSCFPSVAEVCQRSRLSRRGTQKVIRRLEDKGYLTVHENEGPGGTNNYQIHPQSLEERTEIEGGEADSPGGERHSRGGEPDDEKGRTSFARNHHEPSNNRQESARPREDDHPAVKVFVDEVGRRPHGTESIEIPEVVGDSQDCLDTFRKECKKARRNAGSPKAVKWGYLADDFKDAMQDKETEGTYEDSWSSEVAPSEPKYSQS